MYKYIRRRTAQSATVSELVLYLDVFGLQFSWHSFLLCARWRLPLRVCRKDTWRSPQVLFRRVLHGGFDPTFCQFTSRSMFCITDSGSPHISGILADQEIGVLDSIPGPLAQEPWFPCFPCSIPGSYRSYRPYACIATCF